MDLYLDNYILLLNKIKGDLRRYRTDTISWFGRINVIKMMILPKVLYLFQVLPIKIPEAYFKILGKIMRGFIWNNKKARISMEILSRSRSEGGIQLPDFKKYYEASVLKRLIDWLQEESQRKKWVGIEENQSGKDLGLSVWIPRQYRGLSRDSPKITKETFRIWDRISKMKRWSQNSPNLPLTGTDYFLPGREGGGRTH